MQLIVLFNYDDFTRYMSYFSFFPEIKKNYNIDNSDWKHLRIISLAY